MRRFAQAELDGLRHRRMSTFRQGRLGEGKRKEVRKMAYYDTCPECGANLDPGERCDCRRSDGYQYIEKERAAKADTPSKNTSIVLPNLGFVKWSCK